MTWVNLLNLLLSLASKVADYVNNKQLLEAGEAKAISKSLQKEKERVKKARDIQRRLNPNWLSRIKSKYRK